MVTFQKRYQENTILLAICKCIADLLIVIALAFALTYFICDRTQVIGSSMQPVIASEDTPLINRLAYAFTKPKRFSVIAFTDGVAAKKIYIKRVIGLPGETVQIKDGKVYINDVVLEKDKSTDVILTAGLAANGITLGEDEYFVLGDNRNNSEDSRFASIGIVKKEQIRGKAWVVVKPLNRIHLVR